MNDPLTLILAAGAVYVLAAAFTAKFLSINEDSAPETDHPTEKDNAL